MNTLENIKNRDIRVFRNQKYPERAKAAGDDAARIVEQGIKYSFKDLFRYGTAKHFFPQDRQSSIDNGTGICSTLVNDVLEKHGIGIVDTKALDAGAGRKIAVAPNYMAYALGVSKPYMRIGPYWKSDRGTTTAKGTTGGIRPGRTDTHEQRRIGPGTINVPGLRESFKQQYPQYRSFRDIIKAPANGTRSGTTLSEFRGIRETFRDRYNSAYGNYGIRGGVLRGNFGNSPFGIGGSRNFGSSFNSHSRPSTTGSFRAPSVSSFR